mgnify:CR=1 FL=1
MASVWWVNQKNPQYAIDVKRGYRWSPTRGRKGRAVEGWRVLEDMREGDVWICWSASSIHAIGVVNRPPVATLDWPHDQSNQNLEDFPDHAGHRVYFDHFPLDRPIKADEIPDDWKRKAGPFRANLWVKLASVEPVDADAAKELRPMFADRWPEGSPWCPSKKIESKTARATKFWLDIHTPESWERFLQGDVEVVTLDRKAAAIQPGDIFLTYIAGDGGRWVSADEVVSEARPSVEKLYLDYDSQWEWAIRPLGPRLSLAEGIVVRENLSQLELFRGYESNWGVRIRKSASEISERDAELIIGWIDAKSEGTN